MAKRPLLARPQDRRHPHRKHPQGQHCRRSVVGIGVNVNQQHFAPSLPNPVSLRQATGQRYDPILLAGELCGYLEQRIRLLATGQVDGLLAAYNERLYGKGRSLQFQAFDGYFTAQVQEVDAEGILTICRPEAVRYRFGELTFQPPLLP